MSRCSVSGAARQLSISQSSVTEALKALGYVQRFGVGIATARRLLRDNGNGDVEFELSDTYVSALVRKAI